MDGIDITDSAFALDVPGIIPTGGGLDSWDYSMYISIGTAIVAAIIGFIIYKFYQNKSNDQEEDCPGGFCTMGDHPITSSEV
jgi:hypothetical protein